MEGITRFAPAQQLMNQSKTNSRIARLLALPAAFILFLALIVVLLSTRPQRELASNDYISQIDEMVIDQIRNYESTSTKARLATGAPKLTVDDSQTPAKEVFLAAVVEKHGYSVVSATSDMPKEKLEEDKSGLSSKQLDSSDEMWLKSSSSIDALIRQAADAGTDWTFGWIQAGRPVQPAVIEREMRPFGARLVGRTGNLIRAKLPKNRASLEALSELVWIDGIGALPSSFKMIGDIAETAESSSPSSLLPVFVTVVTPVFQDEFREEFERMGMVVGHFDASIRTYSAVIRGDQLSRLAKLDFVQSIEPIAVVTASLDSAVPAMGADSLRKVGIRQASTRVSVASPLQLGSWTPGSTQTM